MRTFSLMFVLVIITTVPARSLALSADQLQVLQEGIPYFNTEASSCNYSTTSVPAGTLPSFLPEPYNGAFTEAANKYTVAPALIAALFTEEHFTGTPADQIPIDWAQFIKEHSNPNSGWAVGGSDGHTWPDGTTGAEGPFQFEPDTWLNLGIDADNNGIKDPNNLLDAAFSAANYAQTDGAAVSATVDILKSFIFSYNHSDSYVNDVLQYYNYYSSAGSTTPSGGATTIVSISSSCDSGGVVAGSVAQTAVGLSWPDNSHGASPSPAYVSAMQQYNKDGYSGTAGQGNDCGVFVATVMHASGADPNYPSRLTTTQAQYVIDHPEKYTIIYPATSTAQLQPGDILILNEGTTQNPDGSINVGSAGGGSGGHTMIYVGPQGPNGYNEASASWTDRSANLGVTQLTDTRGQYLIARLK